MPAGQRTRPLEVLRGPGLARCTAPASVTELRTRQLPLLLAGALVAFVTAGRRLPNLHLCPGVSVGLQPPVPSQHVRHSTARMSRTAGVTRPCPRPGPTAACPHTLPTWPGALPAARPPKQKPPVFPLWSPRAVRPHSPTAREAALPVPLASGPATIVPSAPPAQRDALTGHSAPLLSHP